MLSAGKFCVNENESIEYKTSNIGLKIGVIDDNLYNKKGKLNARTATCSLRQF